MKAFKLLLCIALLLFVSAGIASAQDATPEITPEATVESAPTLTEIFAGLPQTRQADGGYVVGEPDAPITIIEFSDFACPHCEDYAPVIDQVITDYVATGQAKFEFRVMPTAGGVKTYIVGRLMDCANDQQPGAYWTSYELMYAWAIPGNYNGNVPQLLADELKIDYDQMMTCANDPEQVDTDMAFADANGITGTPAVLVRHGNGDPEAIVLDGVTYDRGGVPFDVLAQVIENANANPQPEQTPEMTPEATAEAM